jgi:hypothetical protein
MTKPLLPLALAAALFLGACDQNSKLTDKNYESIKTGMLQSQVESILGAGTDDSGHGSVDISNGGIASQKGPAEKVLVWKDKKQKIVVIFQGGKVVQKQKTPL